MKPRILERLPLLDILAVVILLAASVKFVWGMEHNLDITLYDESLYLYFGVKLRTFGLPNPQLAPLYASWYFVLSQFMPERVSLYYLNYKLMVVLPGLVGYAFLRTHRVSVPVSLTAAWLLLVSHGNAYGWPKVCNFALVVILLTFLLMQGTRSIVIATATLSIGALLVSYVRPEYFMTYLLLSVVFVISVIYQWSVTKKVHASIIATLVLCGLISLLLIRFMGLPVRGSRSMDAFAQHFAVNWASWTGEDKEMNPWTNWREITAQNFGPARTIVGAFLNNPNMFFRHVTFNARRLPNIFITDALPLIFPTDAFSKVLVVVFISGLFVNRFSSVQQNFSAHRNTILFLWLFAVQGIISAILIYPRDHYLLPVYMLLFLSIVILLDGQKSPRSNAVGVVFGRRYLILAGLFLVALTPFFRVNKGQPNLKVIRLLQSLHIQKPVYMLEAQGGYHFYLTDNYHRIAEYDKRKGEGFFEFLRRTRVNMIVLSHTLSRDVRFVNDKEWRRFLSNPRQYGFVRIGTKIKDRTLLVQGDLLK